MSGSGVQENAARSTSTAERIMGKYMRHEKAPSVEPVLFFTPCTSYVERLLANPEDTKLTSDKRLGDIQQGIEKVIYILQRDLAMPLSTRGKQYRYLHEFKQFAAYQWPGVSGAWLRQYAQNLYATVMKLQRNEPTTPAEEETLRSLAAYVANRAKHIAKTQERAKRIQGKSPSESASTARITGNKFGQQ